VGGGSEINSGLYHRTPPEILAQWREEYHVDGLTETELLPCFKACEQDVSVSLLPGVASAASLKLALGAARLGWSSQEVPRWVRFTSKEDPGVRQSMTRTYLPRFLKAGGQLLPRARLLSIRSGEFKWHLKVLHEADGPLDITTERLFLCCGAVQTPSLLRRSGITRNCGNSFQVHPTAKIVARFPDTVNAHDMGVPVHQVKQFAPKLSFGCSVSTPAYLALATLDHSQAFEEISSSWTNMATYYAMLTGQGSGTVRTVPGFRDPLVRYSLTLQDRRDLADGLRKLSILLFNAGASTLYPSMPRSKPLHSLKDVEALPKILPNGLANLMTIHLFSSCPMGENRRKCAANSFGRVHGFDNLFISDASLLCTAPSVNPQGTIMALARRNALHFLGSL
jgi:choline dehydrogenase-like flavoprotein